MKSNSSLHYILIIVVSLILYPWIFNLCEKHKMEGDHGPITQKGKLDLPGEI